MRASNQRFAGRTLILAPESAGMKTGPEKEMRTLYIEGLASHDGPSRASAVREGGGEASVGVHAGEGMEPRN
jgi:hypothetical protein